jgi:hypothetical protein
MPFRARVRRSDKIARVPNYGTPQPSSLLRRDDYGHQLGRLSRSAQTTKRSAETTGSRITREKRRSGTTRTRHGIGKLIVLARISRRGLRPLGCAWAAQAYTRERVSLGASKSARRRPDA